MKEKRELKSIQLQRKTNHTLLLSSLPMSALERMRHNETVFDHVEDGSVMFIQVLTEDIEQLDLIFTRLDILTDVHQCQKIKSIQNEYLVICTDALNHQIKIAELAVHCCKEFHVKSIQLKIGISRGGFSAGILGISKFLYDGTYNY